MIRTMVKKDPKKETVKVPDYLIREEIEGKPYFYRGYKAVLNNEKTLEDIMGASSLQSMIIEILIRFLIINLSRKKYRIFTNETGGHIKKGTNLSFDIAIFDRKILPFEKVNEYYTNVPPKMIFEIDVKIDLEDENGLDYINLKTEKLLEYGTELIVWVLTKQKKLLVARPNKEWQFINWSKNTELIENIILNVGQLIEEEEELG